MCELACHYKSDSNLKAEQKLIKLPYSNVYLYKKKKKIKSQHKTTYSFNLQKSMKYHKLQMIYLQSPNIS